MLAYLIKITTLNAETGDRQSFYLCSVNDRRVTAIGGSRWEPAITEAPAIGMQFWNGDFEQGTDAGTTRFTINLESMKKSYPDIVDAAWMGGDVEIRIGRVGDEWPWRPRFKGKITSYGDSDWPSMPLSANVDVAPFENDVLNLTYAGTGDAEGGADLKGQVKPLALGWPMNVEPVLINEVDSVYQFSAYGPIEAVVVLYERASAFPASSGDYADYAALVAATIAPGHWATCLAEGLIRLGAPAYGVITGDLKGHAVNGVAPRASGDIVKVLASISDTPDDLVHENSLAAMDAEGATNIDIMVTDQVTFIEAARRVVLPCNRQVVVSNLGVMIAMKPSFSNVVALTLHSEGRRSPRVFGISEGATSLPYRKTTMAAELCWRVQSFDEIASSATLIDRGDYDPATVYREGNIVTMPGGARWEYISTNPQAGITPGTNPAVWASMEGETTYPDGTPISDLQPVEGGSDVTSSVEGSLAITVDCDSSGVPLAGSIPRDFAYKLFRNGVDVTAASVWSLSVLAGTMTASIDSATGIVTLSALSSDGRMQVSAAYTTATSEVITRSVEIVITRNIAVPSGPNTASGTVNASSVTGSTASEISGAMSITVGASGTVDLAANYSFTANDGLSSSAYAQWYKWNGSIYVAIGTEVASSNGAVGTSEPGDGSCSTSDTGNTPDSVQQYRLFGRPAISSRSINFSGSISGYSA